MSWGYDGVDTGRDLYTVSPLWESACVHVCTCACALAPHLSLHAGRGGVQQGEQVLHEGVLLGQVLPAHVGAAQRQHHGQQLEAVGVRRGVVVAGLRVGVLLAGDGVLPLLAHAGGLHADGLHDVRTHLGGGEVGETGLRDLQAVVNPSL